MTLPLYTVEKRTPGRVYCGPFCVMSITGLPHETIRAAINARRGRPYNKPVMGTHEQELRESLFDLGWFAWTCYEYGRNEGPTLASWLRLTHGKREMTAYYLIQLSHHWVLVAGMRFVDTYSKHPVSLSDAPWRRAKVKSVLAVAKR